MDDGLVLYVCVRVRSMVWSDPKHSNKGNRLMEVSPLRLAMVQDFLGLGPSKVGAGEKDPGVEFFRF